MSMQNDETAIMTAPVLVPVAPMTPRLPSVNLLPPEIYAGRTLRRIQIGFGVAVVVSSLVVSGLWYSADITASAEKSRLDAVTAQAADAQTKVSRLSWVTATVNAIEARKAMVSGALHDEVLWSRYLNDLAITTPPGVWVESMTVVPVAAPAATAGAKAGPTAPPTAGALPSNAIATMTFTGRAMRQEDVAKWLESFSRDKAYVDVYFSDSTVDDSTWSQQTYKFTSTLTVTTAALNAHASGASSGS